MLHFPARHQKAFPFELDGTSALNLFFDLF